MRTVGRPQFSNASRCAAGLSGFYAFTQCGERPETYRDPRPFGTLPLAQTTSAIVAEATTTHPPGELTRGALRGALYCGASL
jgi:hypothetical protein